MINGRVGFAVIGVGTWGELHAEAYGNDPRAQLLAVCDVNAARAAEIADRYGAERYYTDYSEMLLDSRIDAVSIATPDFVHRDPALMAIKLHKHILLEKPLATTVADAEEIVQAAKAAGVKGMVDFHNRWNPPYAEAKLKADHGEIGEVQYIYARQSSKQEYVKTMPWADKTNILWFGGSHSVDLARWFFDDDVASVYCVTRSRVLAAKGIDTPGFLTTIMEFERGGVAVVEVSWLVPDTDPAIEDFQLEILGSEGGFYLDTFHDRCLAAYTKSSASYPDMFVRPLVNGRTVGFAVKSIEHFRDCVIEDREPPVGLEEGLKVTQIICAALESAQQGRKIRLT